MGVFAEPRFGEVSGSRGKVQSSGLGENRLPPVQNPIVESLRSSVVREAIVFDFASQGDEAIELHQVRDHSQWLFAQGVRELGHIDGAKKKNGSAGRLFAGGCGLHNNEYPARGSRSTGFSHGHVRHPTEPEPATLNLELQTLN